MDNNLLESIIIGIKRSVLNIIKSELPDLNISLLSSSSSENNSNNSSNTDIKKLINGNNGNKENRENNGDKENNGDNENNKNKENNVLDHIINSLFNFTHNESLIFVQWSFVVLLLHSQYIIPEDKILEEETYRIYDCILSLKDNSYIVNFKINFKLEDSLYLLVTSILQSYIKTLNNKEENNILKVLDNILTKNIDRIQKNKSINYEPMKTPIIKEILPIIVPFLDTFEVYSVYDDQIK